VQTTKQAVEEGTLVAAHVVEAARRWYVEAQRADTLPEDAVAVVPECHTEVGAVPQDRPQGAKIHAQHHFIVVKWDGVAINREKLIADVHDDVTGVSAARHTVTAGHCHMGATTVMEVEAHAVSSSHADKVVGGPGVEEGGELEIADEDI
jgi:hypothetical protein